MTIMLRKIFIFINSMQFMNSSLESLFKNLPKINSSICFKIWKKTIRISKTKINYRINI